VVPELSPVYTLLEIDCSRLRFSFWQVLRPVVDGSERAMAAGNEWINGYLEAILDAGVKHRGATGAPLPLPRLPGLGDDDGARSAAAAYSPTRYFVEEVVSRFDDRDLHKTWTKVRAVLLRSLPLLLLGFLD
jgi:hypothetical protein